METLKVQILIIGGGVAGLNCALNLSTEDVVLIENNGSNSLLSAWNLTGAKRETLKEEMLTSGGGLNDKKLLEVFLDNLQKAVKDLRKIGVEFRKSNIGLIPVYLFPGVEIRKIFLEKLERKKIKIINGKVIKFLIDKKGKIRGVEAVLPKQKNKIIIFFNYLVLASGGLSGFFNFKTGSEGCDGSIISLCNDAGLRTRDINSFMIHPLLITDERFPRVLLSGDLLTKMTFEDEEEEKFLSPKSTLALKTGKHHSLFEEMGREFYIQSKKGKIFCKIKCSDHWFENFKKNNEFGYIFKNFKRGDIGKIEIHPAFHYLSGGIAVNERAQTSQEHIYAAGEIVGGLHGKNRVGGTAIIEAMVFAKIAANQINQEMIDNGKAVGIPVKIKRVGSLGLSEKMKERAWKFMLFGRKNDLKIMNTFLKKKTLSSQEKLLKTIIASYLTSKTR